MAVALSSYESYTESMPEVPPLPTNISADADDASIDLDFGLKVSVPSVIDVSSAAPATHLLIPDWRRHRSAGLLNDSMRVRMTVHKCDHSQLRRIDFHHHNGKTHTAGDI